MAQIIRLKAGLTANLPSSGLNAREMLVTTDRFNAYFSADSVYLYTVTPAIETLPDMPSIDGATDYLMMHDADGTGRREKKITFTDFKNALNIPPGSTDEKVAVVSGGTGGYLWGTNGTDGVLQVGAGLSYTKDAGNGFVTIGLNIQEIDGGTF